MDGRKARACVYAVYKGDKFIDEGTKEELAQRFGVKVKTVGFWVTPRNAKRDKGNRKIAINIGRIDED
jgi:hypothetical protein